MNKRLLLVVSLVLSLIAVMPAGAEAAPWGAATRISFAAGATSATTSGQLATRQTREYVLRAGAGQILRVELWPNAGANFSIWGADGAVLKPQSDLGLGWQGRLPKTQDYYIQVIALDQSLSYCLRATAFARIQFERGANSAAVSSAVQRCFPQGSDVVGGYALGASAGQTMRVALTSPNHNVYLTIVRANGTLVKSYDDWNTAWEGVLPATGDYYLLPVSVGDDASFSMTVWISPLGSQAPTRIRFAPGTTSATVSGSLPAGGEARYVLGAARGQRLELHLRPAARVPLPIIDVTVTGPGGLTWSGLSLDSLIDPLPASGDYVIRLATKPWSPGANYSMQVTIPAL